MQRCANCNAIMIKGYSGKGEVGKKYCRESCYLQGYVAPLADTVAPAELEERIKAVHAGRCPRCQGPGPVDVCTVGRVWAAIRISSRSQTQYLSCRNCAKKLLAGGACFSFFLGWWSIMGFFSTPIYIYNNLKQYFNEPDPAQPSANMRALVRMNIAKSIADKQISSGQIYAPPIPDPSGAAQARVSAPPIPNPGGGNPALSQNESPFSTLK